MSWFLRFTARMPALGAVRFDLLVLVLTLLSIFLSGERKPEASEADETSRSLRNLFIYALVTIPFVEWPGSVMKFGLESFVKAIVFYLFTVSLVTTEKKLKIFMGVFMACQSIRIIEPLYLHLTIGYWGDAAYMSNWEMMDRLSGAPKDVVNPNGLAFIIVSILPFLHSFSSLTKWTRVAYWTVAPLSLWTLVLTASRSGFLGLLIIAVGVWMKAQKKTFLTVAFGIAGIIVFVNLNADQRDRYLSIFSSQTNNSATAAGRTEGLKANFRVAMRKPLFGHGLGTSYEANVNFGEDNHIAHNLYAEVAQELGFLGLIVFLIFMRSVIRNAHGTAKLFKTAAGDDKSFLFQMNSAMQVWLFMNIIFSFASYGLNGYEWYLFAGLTVVTRRLAIQKYRQPDLSDALQTAGDAEREWPR